MSGRDEDGNGCVSKKEFRKAIAALGVDAPKAEVEALFDSFDPDRSGEIDYKEFQRALAPLKASRGGKGGGGGVKPPAPLHPSQKGTDAKGVQVYDQVVLTAPDGTTPMPTQLLPRHCVQFTWGAALHDELVTDPERDLLVVQGSRAEVGSFSAFHDRHKLRSTGLATELRRAGVTHVYVCGLALDRAVTHTALHAAEAGFVTSIIEDACRASDFDALAASQKRLEKASVQMLRSHNVRAYTQQATLAAVADAERRAPQVKKLLAQIKDVPVHGPHVAKLAPKLSEKTEEERRAHQRAVAAASKRPAQLHAPPPPPQDDSTAPPPPPPAALEQPPTPPPPPPLNALQQEGPAVTPADKAAVIDHSGAGEDEGQAAASQSLRTANQEGAPAAELMAVSGVSEEGGASEANGAGRTSGESAVGESCWRHVALSLTIEDSGSFCAVALELLDPPSRSHATSSAKRVAMVAPAEGAEGASHLGRGAVARAGGGGGATSALSASAVLLPSSAVVLPGGSGTSGALLSTSGRGSARLPPVDTTSSPRHARRPEEGMTGVFGGGGGGVLAAETPHGPRRSERHQRMNSHLFHDAGRSLLPPHMRSTQMSVDWDAYATTQRKRPRPNGVSGGGAAARAYTEVSDEVGRTLQVRMPSVSHLDNRHAVPSVYLEQARGAVPLRMHHPTRAADDGADDELGTALGSRLPRHHEGLAAPGVLPAICGPTSARGTHGAEIEMGAATAGAALLHAARGEAAADDSLRALQHAAAAHRRKAEAAHAVAVLNPRHARREVELALRAEEERASMEPRGATYGGGGGLGNHGGATASLGSATLYGHPPTIGPLSSGGGGFESMRLFEGGLKKSRRLKEAPAQAYGGAIPGAGLLPRPPRHPRKKGRNQPRNATGDFAPTAPEDTGSVPAANSSLRDTLCGTLAEGGGQASAPPPMELQPMPRFMGAGPVANGHLLRSGPQAIGTW